MTSLLSSSSWALAILACICWACFISLLMSMYSSRGLLRSRSIQLGPRIHLIAGLVPAFTFTVGQGLAAHHVHQVAQGLVLLRRPCPVPRGGSAPLPGGSPLSPVGLAALPRTSSTLTLRPHSWSASRPRWSRTRPAMLVTWNFLSSAKATVRRPPSASSAGQPVHQAGSQAGILLHQLVDQAGPAGHGGIGGRQIAAAAGPAGRPGGRALGGR